MSKGQIAEQAQQNPKSQPPVIPEDVAQLFAQVDPRSIETFYQGHQFWTLRSHIDELQAQIAEVQRQIAHNTEKMQQVEPSSIALSTLAQLQAHNVDDLDLLEHMLEKGDTWLDHTLQLLARCEALDVIRGDYTQWCENALEGAYDWIDSMDQASPALEPAEEASHDSTTETLLLQKLLSDEDEPAPKAPQVAAESEPAEVVDLPVQPARRSRKTGKITQPLAAEEEPAQIPQDERGMVTAIEEHASSLVRGKAKVTRPLKLTRPLEVTELPEIVAESDLVAAEPAQEPELVTPQTILNAQTLQSEEQRTDKMPALAHAYMLYSLGLEQQPESAYTEDDAMLSSVPPTPVDADTDYDYQEPQDVEDRQPLSDHEEWSDDAAAQQSSLSPDVQASPAHPTTTREAMTMLANNQPQAIGAAVASSSTPARIETQPKKRGLFARLGFGRRKPRA